MERWDGKEMPHFLEDEGNEGNVLKEGDGSKMETKSASSRKGRKCNMRRPRTLRYVQPHLLAKKKKERKKEKDVRDEKC
jgi:hypothetical protein